MGEISSGSINELLSSIYYDTKNSASFSSIKNLLNEAKKQIKEIKISDVKEWLSKQITYTLHKPVKRNFKRNRIIVKKIDEQWEADLVDMREFSAQNNNYNYILTIIDCFSKYAFAVPLISKTGHNIKKAFENIFKIRKPNFLRTDKGKEFMNKIFQNYLQANMINFFTSKDERIKCAIVERFNRTLKKRMFTYFTARGTRRYIDILDDLLENYNNSHHRTIKMCPKDVNKDNESRVYENIYQNDSYKTKQNIKIKPGDKVRVQYKHKPFDKGYYPNWTDEIFTVERSKSGDNRIVFRIKDYSGEMVEQIFYPEELQKITENLYRIEKVIKKRKRKGIKEIYVKWLNYPERYNTWIPETELSGIYQ